MPTIKQLPAATAVTSSDLLPVSQNGLTRSLMVSTLLNSTQPLLSLAQETLLGRVSPGLGGPEAVGIGLGLAVQRGAVAATGTDHVGFALTSSLLAGDEVILNSNSAPTRIAAIKLRSLFSAGPGVEIDDAGVISALGGGAGSGAQGPKGDTGPQGPAGQGFTLRGIWQAGTSYAAYDVVTFGGQTYVAPSMIAGSTTFTPSAWTLMSAQGAVGATGIQGPAGPIVPATAAALGAVKPGAGLSVSPDGALAINSVSLPTIAQGGAAVGQVLGWTGTAWGPTTAPGGAYAAIAPITITAGAVSLSQAGATSGQVLAWNGTAWAPATYAVPPATASSLGGVKQGSGVTIAADGTISASGTAGVSTFNARTGSVTLTVGDVTAVLGTGSSARTALGLAPVAATGAFSDLTGTPAIAGAATDAPAMDGSAAVGAASTFARADHVHPSDTSRLAAGNNLSDLASAVTARSNLGLGGAATLNVGAGAGTIAAGNDVRIAGALQASAIPAASGQLLGGSGSAGAATAISVGSGLSISGGTLSATSTVPVASTSALGGVKSDGNTVQIAADGTLSVVSAPVTALTDISSGNLGGPALSDVDTLNRGGVDYRTTLSAQVALYRKTPAGSRTITLAAGATAATLSASDHDRTVVVAGSAAGSLTVDGTATDGFRCQVINHTGAPLTFSGIAGLGATSVPNSASCWVSLANSALEATVPGTSSGYALPAATVSQLGGVKPDGATLTAAADGTLSVLTISTHALAQGAALTAADEFAVYSASSATDVKYTMGQVSTFSHSNLPSWTTAARPMLASTQVGQGFNTTLGRSELWDGKIWNQHCLVSDFTASAGQIYGGSSMNGVPTPIAIGAGLSLSGNTLTAAGASGAAPVSVMTVASSGDAQALAFSASGSRAYDVTLTGNCAFAISGGTVGELQAITLVIRGGTGGFSASLPNGIKWPGGVAPTIDASAGSYNEFYIRTIDGGATYSGSY